MGCGAGTIKHLRVIEFLILTTLALTLISNSLSASTNSGGGLVKIWEREVNGLVLTSSWNPINSYLAVGSSTYRPRTNGSVIIFNQEGRVVWIKRLNSVISSLAWSPEGNIIAVGTFSLLRGGYLLLYGLNGSLLMNKSLQKYMVSGISWSPDGKELALLLKYFHWSGVLVLDLSGHKLWVLGISGPVYTSISWSPEGDLIAVGNGLGSVSFVNVRGHVVRVVKGLGLYVTQVSWSPTGDKLAVGSNNSVIVLSNEGEKLSVWRTEGSKPLPYWIHGGLIIISFRKNQVALTDTLANKSFTQVLDTKIYSISCSHQDMKLAVGGEYEVITFKLLTPPKENNLLIITVILLTIISASAAVAVIKKVRA